MITEIKKTATEAGHVALGAGVVAAQQVQTRAQLALSKLSGVQLDLSETIDKARTELEARSADANALANSIRERVADQAKALSDAAEPYTDAIKTRATELVSEAKDRIEPAVERIAELVNFRAA